MAATISALATRFDLQDHEVLASLDVSTPQNIPGDTEVGVLQWSEAEACKVLALMLEQAAAGRA